MEERYVRTAALYGENAVKKLNSAHVAVFGLGGVGGYAVEALARAGVGTLTLVDGDSYSLSNLNRQLFATEKTVGVKKTAAAKDRVKEISPTTEVIAVDAFVLEDNVKDFDFSSFDYVIDAIDTITGKLAIIKACKKVGTSVISCMGTGNKLDPTQLKVADIAKTKTCPLCRVMRKLLKDNGVDGLTVVYSEEAPKKPLVCENDKKQVPASMVFVPSVAGMTLAYKVASDIISK